MSPESNYGSVLNIFQLSSSGRLRRREGGGGTGVPPNRGRSRMNHVCCGSETFRTCRFAATEDRVWIIFRVLSSRGFARICYHFRSFSRSLKTVTTLYLRIHIVSRQHLRVPNSSRTVLVCTVDSGDRARRQHTGGGRGSQASPLAVSHGPFVLQTKTVGPGEV